MRVQKTTKVRYRISKVHGCFMMLAGLIFDTIPLLVLIAGFSIPTMLGNAAGQAVAEGATENAGIFCLFAAATEKGGFAEQVFSKLSSANCSVQKTVAETAEKVGTGAGALANTLLAPEMWVIATMLHTAASLVVVIVSFLAFVVWFGIKGVLIIQPKTGKLLIAVFTFIAKLIPLVNLLIPAITIATVLHVRASRKEDRKKHEKHVKMANKLDQNRTPGGYAHEMSLPQRSYPQVA